MSITATREVVEVSVTATRNGQSIVLQPILIKSEGGFDGIVNGGTP